MVSSGDWATLYKSILLQPDLDSVCRMIHVCLHIHQKMTNIENRFNTNVHKIQNTMWRYTHQQIKIQRIMKAVRFLLRFWNILIQLIWKWIHVFQNQQYHSFYRSWFLFKNMCKGIIYYSHQTYIICIKQYTMFVLWLNIQTNIINNQYIHHKGTHKLRSNTCITIGSYMNI